ncbi:MAG: hypothetical protein AAFU41_00805 [Pseudomonadota bacterium]
MKIEVETVDRNAVTGPVKIGIGTEAQFPALYSAGAEEARTHSWVKLTAEEDADLLVVAFRPIDTIIMVQPNLLSIAEIKRLAGMVAGFYVPECGDFKLQTDKAIQMFRKLKPDLADVERVENRGGKVKYPQPNQDQLNNVVRWWRDPALKRSDVVRKVSEMLGVDVPAHWVRDKVLKATGSAARKME